SPQPVDELVPVRLVEMRQHLCVAARAQAVSARNEAVTQCSVVEDLAVLGRPDLAGLVGEGLMAQRDVDDAQASGADRGAGDQAGAAVVRTAMAHGVGHPVQRGLRDRTTRRTIDQERACDSAHEPSLALVLSGDDGRWLSVEPSRMGSWWRAPPRLRRAP